MHVIQRGNNRKAIFFAEDDYTRYLDWLADAARANGCTVHAYVLMTNHVHLLVTPGRRQPAANHAIARPPLCPAHQRSLPAQRYVVGGPLPRGGDRGGCVLLLVCRYIELNPVRAGMVRHPRDYRWSSYRAHALGAEDALAAWHPLFNRLGRSAAERQVGYRALFREKLAPEFVAALRTATNGGWA